MELPPRVQLDLNQINHGLLAGGSNPASIGSPAIDQTHVHNGDLPIGIRPDALTQEPHPEVRWDETKEVWVIDDP